MTTATPPTNAELLAASNALEAAGWHVQVGTGEEWIVRTRAQDGLAMDNEGLIAAVPLVTAHPDMTGDELIAALSDDPQPAPTPIMAPALADGAPVLVDLIQIDDNPWQPRLVYDPSEIAELASAIRAEGLLQPPAARRDRSGRYQLAFGHRRRRAFALLAAEDPARWGRMPLYLRELDDEAMVRQAWRENRDRKDLTAYEDAVAIQRYMVEFKWTQAQVAERLGLDRSTVTNKLRLLKLPQVALDQLKDGTLSERQAAALLPLAELPAEILARTRKQWEERDIWMSQAAGEIVKQASDMDSGALRRLVEQFLERVTIGLQKEPWPTVDTGATPVHAPLCKECSIRLRHSNRCPDGACAGRKQEAYAKAQAAAAAASVRLPPLARPAGVKAYQTWYDGLQGVQRQAIKDQAAATGCGNLGVVYEAERMYNAAHKLEKHPNCYLVCVHGVGKQCRCKNALARATDRPEVSAQAQARVDKKRIKNELIGPAETAIVTALSTPTAGTWRELLSHIDRGASQKLADDAALPDVIAAVAAALVRQEIKYLYEYGTPHFPTCQQRLVSLIEKLGAPLPWAEETPPAPSVEIPAEDVRAQTPPPLDIPADSPAIVIHRQLLGFAAGEVAADADALQQLGELLEDLADQLDDATYEDLARRIDDALDTLPESEGA